MTKPNTNFMLTVKDIEMIELALHCQVNAITHGNSVQSSDSIRDIYDLLGRIHNQKTWYRPDAYIGG